MWTYHSELSPPHLVINPQTNGWFWILAVCGNIASQVVSDDICTCSRIFSPNTQHHGSIKNMNKSPKVEKPEHRTMIQYHSSAGDELHTHTTHIPLLTPSYTGLEIQSLSQRGDPRF